MSLAATVTVADAARSMWGAIIVGAGPAGSFAARELARAGQRVLLLDRWSFPRDKVCGCCLNAAALASLDAAGLGDLMRRLGGVRLDRFELAAQGRRAVLPLPAGAAVSRSVFDEALVAAAVEGGAVFLPEATAELGEPDAECRQVRIRANGERAVLRGRVIIAASGLGSTFLGRGTEFEMVVEPSARVGLGTTLRCDLERFASGTIFMAVAETGYAGCVRLENGTLNVAAAVDRAALAQLGPGPAIHALVTASGGPDVAGLRTADWHGTVSLTRRVVRPAGQRVFVVGDAAAYVEPFTGEGMAWALACGPAAAPLVREGIARWSHDLETRWCRLHRRLLGRRLRACRMLALGLRHPRWVWGAVRGLAMWPGIAAPVVRHLNSSIEPMKAGAT